MTKIECAACGDDFPAMPEETTVNGPAICWECGAGRDFGRREMWAEVARAHRRQRLTWNDDAGVVADTLWAAVAHLNPDGPPAESDEDLSPVDEIKLAGRREMWAEVQELVGLAYKPDSVKDGSSSAWTHGQCNCLFCDFTAALAALDPDKGK